LLSKKFVAINQPYEYQKAENIVYCDWLEHFLLHIMISEEYNDLSSGGIRVYFIPELNDIYTGVMPKEEWQINCSNIIKDDIEVYLRLFNRYAVYAAPKEKVSFGKYGIDKYSPFYRYIYLSKIKNEMDIIEWVKNYGKGKQTLCERLEKILDANHFCFKCYTWIGNHKTFEVPNGEYKNSLQSISKRNYCVNCK